MTPHPPFDLLTARSRGAFIWLRNNVPYCGARNPWEETRVILAANPTQGWPSLCGQSPSTLRGDLARWEYPTR